MTARRGADAEGRPAAGGTGLRGMVLAAGRGERMRPFTYRTPKPAIPVLNRPLVSYSLELLRRAGVQRAAMNAHSLPGVLEEVARRVAPPGMELTVFPEADLLGTAGGLRNAENVLRGDGPFLVANGDFVCDVDPGAVLETHRRSGAVATLALIPYHEHLGYHPVEAEDGRVLRIAGRPEADGPRGTRYIFTGLHVLEPEVLDRIPSGEPWDINRQVYPALLQDGRTVAAHVADGAWAEFGTPGEYLRRTLQMFSGEFEPLLRRAGIPLERSGNHALVLGAGASVNETASLREAVVLGDGVSVGREVKLRRTIAWNDVKIGYGSDLCDVILGEGVILPPNSTFHHKIVLARGDDLPAEAGGERQGDLVFFRL